VLTLAEAERQFESDARNQFPNTCET
jgi:hypothetical protein